LSDIAAVQISGLDVDVETVCVLDVDSDVESFDVSPVDVALCAVSRCKISSHLISSGTYRLTSQVQRCSESIGRLLDPTGGVSRAYVLCLNGVRVPDVRQKVWPNVCGGGYSESVAERRSHTIDSSGHDIVSGWGSARGDALSIVRSRILARNKRGRRESEECAPHRSDARHEVLTWLVDRVRS
jgi:hypothetical protein